MELVICEKPSIALSIAKVIGAAGRTVTMKEADIL